MTITKTALSFALSLAAGGFMFAQPAHAGSSQNTMYEVSYKPSELGTSQGTETLLSQIHDTANQLCWAELGPERHTEKLKVERCLKEATQDLVDKVGHTNLDMTHARTSTPKKLTTRRQNMQLASAK